MTVRVAELVEQDRPTSGWTVVVDEHFATFSVQLCTHPFVPSVAQKPY